MRSQLYLLCFVLFTVAVHANTTDKPEQESKLDDFLLRETNVSVHLGDSAVVTKAPVVEEPVKVSAVTRKPERAEEEEVDDDSAGLSSYADSRYSAFDEPVPAARTRQRWSPPTTSFDDTFDALDRSRYTQEEYSKSLCLSEYLRCLFAAAHSYHHRYFPRVAVLCSTINRSATRWWM